MRTYESTTASNGAYPLYEARWEHDACGTGFLADVSGAASHLLIEQALTVLANLTHRGAQDADAETNDGAGLLTSIPRALLRAELQAQQIVLANPEDLAVGMLFLPSATSSPTAHARARVIVEQVLDQLSIPLLIWREPPLDLSVPGTRARASMPTILQTLLARPDHLSADEFDREALAGRTAYRLLYRLVLFAHHCIQGPAGANAARAFLSRPGQRALYQLLRDLPPALQHKYVSLLATGSADAFPGT